MVCIGECHEELHGPGSGCLVVALVVVDHFEAVILNRLQNGKWVFLTSQFYVRNQMCRKFVEVKLVRGQRSSWCSHGTRILLCDHGTCKHFCMVLELYHCINVCVFFFCVCSCACIRLFDAACQRWSGPAECVSVISHFELTFIHPHTGISRIIMGFLSTHINKCL